MIFLSQKEIQKIIPLEKIQEIIKAVEKSFYDYGKQKVQMPPKMYLNFSLFQGDLRIMPSYSEALQMAGTKIVNVHPLNPKFGLKTVMAIIILNDPKTGLPLALMDGTYITGLRTGAAGALAIKYLARKDAKTLGVVGAGQQSIYQIMAISKIKKLKEISVYDINEKAIEKLQKILLKYKIKIKAEPLDKVCQKDLLVTLTPARKPVVKKEWLKEGVHINAIGADAKGKEELEPEILKQARIFVDSFEQASHSGEINVPLSKGIIKKEDIAGELSEVIIGKKLGRKSQEEITIFDSTGLAIQDLYSANLIFQKAKKLKIGKSLKIF